MKLIIQKLSVLTLVLTVLFTTALPAQAELSSENKETLKEIMANNPNDLLAIMTYLYSLMYQGTSLPGTTTGTKTTETPSTTTTETPQNNAQLCTYAKGITKNLSRGMNDPQVKTLQKFLNALAVQDTNYKAVIASGDGSYGNETTYFGSGTQNAVKVLQGRLRVLQSGMVGPLTRAAMVRKVCGTGATTTGGTGSGSLVKPTSGTEASNVTTNSTTLPPVDTPVVTPVLMADKTSITSGELVTFTYDPKGLTGCVIQNITTGSGTRVSNSPIRYTMRVNGTSSWLLECGSLKSDTIVITITTTDSSTNTNTTNSTKPILTVDKTSVPVGTAVLFQYDPKGMTDCIIRNITAGAGTRVSNTPMSYGMRISATSSWLLDCNGVTSDTIVITATTNTTSTSGGLTPPVASFTSVPTCIVGQPFTTKFKSNDVEKDSVRFDYSWNWAASPAQGVNAISLNTADNTEASYTHTYTTAGTYTIAVRSIDRMIGVWDTATVTCGDVPRAPGGGISITAP